MGEAVSTSGEAGNGKVSRLEVILAALVRRAEDGDVGCLATILEEMRSVVSCRRVCAVSFCETSTQMMAASKAAVERVKLLLDRVSSEHAAARVSVNGECGDS
jgi:hypothetical protein